MNTSFAMKSICLVGVVFTFIVLLLVGKASAEVYVLKDKAGVLTFTNVPCTEEQLKQGCTHIVVLKPRQWEWRWDTNDDGKVTISDVAGWCRWLFFYPGDLLVHRLLQEKKYADFFELTPASYGGRMSFWVSGACWFFVTCLVGACLDNWLRGY